MSKYVYDPEFEAFWVEYNKTFCQPRGAIAKACAYDAWQASRAAFEAYRAEQEAWDMAMMAVGYRDPKAPCSAEHIADTDSLTERVPNDLASE